MCNQYFRFSGLIFSFLTIFFGLSIILRGEYANELSFGVNEIIKLTKRIDQDWLEGEIDGKVGIFPAGYVQVCLHFVLNNNQNKR